MTARPAAEYGDPVWSGAAPGRRWKAAAPLLLDIGGSIVITATVLLAAASNYATGPVRLDALGAVFIAVANLPVMLRRRAPITALVVCCAGMALFAASGYWEALNGSGSLWAMYTVATRYRSTRSVPAAALHAATQVFAAMITGAVALWLILVLAPMFSAGAWVLGNLKRVLDERNERLAALTEQLERDRIERARRAVVEERVRLARELHDVVAHHMSAISIQAGLARYVFHTDPGTAYTALQAIGDASGKAMADMRRLLTLLRLDPDQPPNAELLEVEPGIDRLGELVDGITAAGVPTTLAVTGAVRELTSGAELCIYRVVQESLTNVLKHAGATHAAVTVDFRPSEVVVRIVDDGSGAVPGGNSATQGHGLIGMRERAKLYGGTLTANTQVQKGFGVVLTLPMSAGTVARGPEGTTRSAGDGRSGDQRIGR
ncbi:MULTISPECIES: sensor histidine kinase [unclassified Nocardia]|uniref:sensor histidine kinase n=1 Tax=unclassified Nocardia TaxID=2637762 RepID=UPI001CE4189D|nr:MULTISPECIES: sensor histidine kinase [unclassified Nocardia]